MKSFINFPKRNLFILLGVLGFGQWFVTDLINISGGSLGFFIICLGGYLYFKSDKPKFNEPKDIKGWKELCENELQFFDEIEKNNNLEKNNSERRYAYQQIINRSDKQIISIINCHRLENNLTPFKKYFSSNIFQFNYIDELSKEFQEKDLDKVSKSDGIIFIINLPLTAKDLLWLQKSISNIPIWLIVLQSKNKSKDEFLELRELIPSYFKKNIIKFDSDKNKLKDIPISLRKFLFNPKKNSENTKKRLLKELHSGWQAEIEIIRRIKLKEIQRKSQVIVAASVFVSPVPSIDVLSITVLNSLMVKEMKSIWDCNWSPDMFNEVSKQIIKASIAQGVIEWSSQTFLSFSKLHGPNWIVAGSLQAISAAYLTRVVSRSLADFMALSKGVTEPDLEFLKNNADKIVQNAFENEKINWKGLISDLKKPLLEVKYT